MEPEDIKWKENDPTHDFKIINDAMVETGMAQIIVPEIMVFPNMIKLALQNHEGTIIGLLIISATTKDDDDLPDVAYVLQLKQIEGLTSVFQDAVDNARKDLGGS